VQVRPGLNSQLPDVGDNLSEASPAFRPDQKGAKHSPDDVYAGIRPDGFRWNLSDRPFDVMFPETFPYEIPYGYSEGQLFSPLWRLT
jgi:hypothetical protein